MLCLENAWKTPPKNTFNMATENRNENTKQHSDNIICFCIVVGVLLLSVSLHGLMSLFIVTMWTWDSVPIIFIETWHCVFQVVSCFAKIYASSDHFKAWQSTHFPLHIRLLCQKYQSYKCHVTGRKRTNLILRCPKWNVCHAFISSGHSKQILIPFNTMAGLWVFQHIHIQTSDILYRNNVLEMCSRINWWYVPTISYNVILVEAHIDVVSSHNVFSLSTDLLFRLVSVSLAFFLVFSCIITSW